MGGIRLTLLYRRKIIIRLLITIYIYILLEIAGKDVGEINYRFVVRMNQK